MGLATLLGVINNVYNFLIYVNTLFNLNLGRKLKIKPNCNRIAVAKKKESKFLHIYILQFLIQALINI
ncbi:hypothetical protein GCM10023163_08070 [Aestuariibaculum suncheonense]